MIRKIILVVFLGIASISMQAQYVFDKGDIAINAGIGYISMDGLLPSVNISAELGLFPTGDVGIISVGGAMEYKYSEINGLHYNQVTIGPRAAWHMHLPFLAKTKYDLYAGIGTGLHHYRNYNLTSFEYDRKIDLYLESFIGGRMMFNDKLGLFVEFGAGAVSSTKAGLVYRL